MAFCVRFTAKALTIVILIQFTTARFQDISEYVSIGRKAYVLVASDRPVTASAADGECKRYRGRLANINDVATFNTLTEMVQGSAPSSLVLTGMKYNTRTQTIQQYRSSKPAGYVTEVIAAASGPLGISVFGYTAVSENTSWRVAVCEYQS